MMLSSNTNMNDYDEANLHLQSEPTLFPMYEQVFNESDPNDLVRFPGFGFWPFWYLEMFKKRRDEWLSNSNLSTADESIKVNQLNSNY